MAPLIPVAMQLATFAPSIIKWITGSDKDEEVAADVVGIAQAITGTGDADAALAAIKADPNKVLEFQLAIAAQKADLDKAYLADVADARARDVALRQSGGSNLRANILAFLAVSGLVLCVWFIARDTALPERAVNAIMFVAGQLANAVMMVYAFEFGSSRGSKEKDNLLAGFTR